MGVCTDVKGGTDPFNGRARQMQARTEPQRTKTIRHMLTKRVGMGHICVTPACTYCNTRTLQHALLQERLHQELN